MAFLEELKEKYEELADSFEEKGWPSPAIVFGVVLAVLLAASYFLFLQPQTQSLAFTVKNAEGNNLADMRVLLFDGERQIGEKSTGEDGGVSFDKVPAKASLKIKVTDPSNVYPQLEGSVSFSTTEVRLENPSPGAAQVFYVTVAVADSSGNAVRAAGVRLAFDDGSMNDSFTDRDGVASFPLAAFPDHVTVSARADGFKSKTASLLKSELEATAGYVQMALESDAERQDGEKDGQDSTGRAFGRVLVAVYFGEDGLPVEGAQVSLVDADVNRMLKSLKTDAAGNALFDDVRVGEEFFVRVAETGKSYGYASDALRLDSGEPPLEVAAAVEKKLKGSFISLLVHSRGQPIAGAEVSLYDSDGRQLDSMFSDDAGKAVFEVAARKAYYVTAYADGFLPSSLTARASVEIQELGLESQSDENSVEVSVEVEDAGEPADAAEVLLFTAGGFPLGLPPAYTQADGTAVFVVPRELDGGPYDVFAKAVRYDKRGESGRVQVDDGAVLSIVLEYEQAEVRIALEDASTAEALSNGSVSVLDSGNAILASCNVDAGNCTLETPAMAEVRLVAAAEGFLQTTSAVLTLNPGERRSVKMQLVSVATARSVSVKFLGLSNGASEVREVGNAEYYLAKFLLTSPSSAKNVGVHAHLSGGDFVKFSEAPAIDNAVVYSSSSFDPQSCYSSSGNSSSIASIDVLFPQGFAGSKEISFKLYVSPQAPASSQFSLNYKAYAVKGGVPVSSPELESYDSFETPGQALAFVQSLCKQKNFVQPVKTTASPLVCDDAASFCRKLYLKSGATVSKTSIEVAKQTEFSLVYDVLSAEAVDSIGVRTANAEFTGSSGIDFASGEDGGGGGLQAAEQRIPVSIEAGKRSAGSLSFKAVKAALSSDLQVAFYSESGTRQFHFNLKITGENPLKRSTPSPARLEVGTPAKVRVKVLDERNNPVEDALVTLFDCDGAPLNSEEPQVQGDGSTDAGERGTYAVQANPAAIGIVGVRIEHEDYRTLEECLVEVAPPSDALEAAPQSLQFKGNSADLSPQTVVFSSPLNQRSSLNVFSDCASNGIPLLSFVPPSFSSFSDSASVDVEVLPDSTAKTSCRLWAEQRISSRYVLTKTVAVSIDVKGPEVPTPTPTPSATPAPTPPPLYPPLTSVVFLELDADGFADAYYSYAGTGEAVGCSLDGTQDFEQGTSVECASGIVHLSADFSSLEPSAAVRLAGRLTVNADDGLRRLFTVLVSRTGTATPTPSPGTTPTPSATPTPTIVPGACASKRCDAGRLLKCCDEDERGEFSRSECDSKAGFDYFSGGAGLEEACSLPEPLCVLSAEPQLVSAPADVSITASHYDLGEQPNTIAVDCGNGRQANLVGCSAGSCTGKCRYSAPGIYEATASVSGVECLSVQVEYSGAATPTPTTSPSPTLSTGPCKPRSDAPLSCVSGVNGGCCDDNNNRVYDRSECSDEQTWRALNALAGICVPSEPSNPEVSSPIYINVDSNGFADKAYSFKQADITSCEIQGPLELTDYVIAQCLGKTILVTADYSGSNITKAFRVRGRLVVQAGEIRKTYAVIVSAANFDAGQNPDGDTTLPPLPSRLEFAVDERNAYFDYLFSLQGFGEAVSSCQVRGVDSSIAAWVQLQYCSPADQRLKVVADFSGSAYRQLLQLVYAGNPSCAGYFGAPQMSYSPFLRQPYDQFGGYLPNQQGYNYADRTAFPGFNPPNSYYQYNPFNAFPQQQFYDRMYNYPPQLQYYNPNTYGRLWSASFANTLPGSCVPTPVQGYVVFTLASGASRRIPLVITATGSVTTPQIPYTPYYGQTQSYVKPPVSVKIDPYTLSRWVLAKESLDGTDFPQLCTIRSDASLYNQVQQGLQQQYGQYPGYYGGQQANYHDYWGRSTGVQQNTRTATTAKNLVSSDDTDAESLCSRADYGMEHEFGVDLKGSGVTARDITPGARLNSPEEAYIDEFYVRSNLHQLTPLAITVGDQDLYKFEPVSGTLQFISVGGDAQVSGEFKLVYDLFEEDGCKFSGIKDASATVQNVDGLPTTVAIAGSLETKKYLFDGREFKESTDENAVKLGVPPKSASLSCSTFKGVASAKISVASFAAENLKEITGMQLKDYAVPMAPGSSFAKLPADKYYRCTLESGNDADGIADMAEKYKKKHDDPEDAYKAYGCKIEDGKLLVNIDYAKLHETADEGEKLGDSFVDAEKVTVYVVTRSPVPSLKSNKNFEIERELDSFALNVKRVPSEKACGADSLAVTFRQGFSSQGGVACAKDTTYSTKAASLLAWPVDVPSALVSSCFGARKDPFDGGPDVHNAVDITAPLGTPVLAAEDGTVVFAGKDADNGNLLKVRHENGLTTAYGHLSAFSVKQGDAVERGKEIGKVGSTGRSTGDHLHFGVYDSAGNAEDPFKYLGSAESDKTFDENVYDVAKAVTLTDSPLMFTPTFLKDDEKNKDKRRVLVLKVKESDLPTTGKTLADQGVNSASAGVVWDSKEKVPGRNLLQCEDHQSWDFKGETPAEGEALAFFVGYPGVKGSEFRVVRLVFAQVLSPSQETEAHQKKTQEALSEECMEKIFSEGEQVDVSGGAETALGDNYMLKVTRFVEEYAESGTKSFAFSFQLAGGGAVIVEGAFTGNAADGEVSASESSLSKWFSQDCTVKIELVPQLNSDGKPMLLVSLPVAQVQFDENKQKCPEDRTGDSTYEFLPPGMPEKNIACFKNKMQIAVLKLVSGNFLTEQSVYFQINDPQGNPYDEGVIIKTLPALDLSWNVAKLSGTPLGSAAGGYMPLDWLRKKSWNGYGMPSDWVVKVEWKGLTKGGGVNLKLTSLPKEVPKPAKKLSDPPEGCDPARSGDGRYVFIDPRASSKYAMACFSNGAKFELVKLEDNDKLGFWAQLMKFKITSPDGKTSEGKIMGKYILAMNIWASGAHFPSVKPAYAWTDSGQKVSVSWIGMNNPLKRAVVELKSEAVKKQS